MRSMKSGPGTCSRSLEIFGFLNPRRDSAFAPKNCSIELAVAIAMMLSYLVANSRFQHSTGGLVNQPKQLTARRLNQLRRELLRLVRTFQDGLQGGSLVGSGYHENYAARVVGRGSGQGDSFGVQLPHPVANHDPIGGL